MAVFVSLMNKICIGLFMCYFCVWELLNLCVCPFARDCTSMCCGVPFSVSLCLCAFMCVWMFVCIFVY